MLSSCFWEKELPGGSHCGPQFAGGCIGAATLQHVEIGGGAEEASGKGGRRGGETEEGGGAPRCVAMQWNFTSCSSSWSRGAAALSGPGLALPGLVDESSTMMNASHQLRPEVNAE